MKERSLSKTRLYIRHCRFTLVKKVQRYFHIRQTTGQTFCFTQRRPVQRYNLDLRRHLSLLCVTGHLPLPPNVCPLLGNLHRKHLPLLGLGTSQP